MCGIVGIAGNKPVAGRLLEGLRKLEYRGYDSSGIATVHDKKIQRLRASGKLVNLEKLLHQLPLNGHTGIGHTRWATHGLPTEENAHPHATERVALLHNGIIENFSDLKQELQRQGVVFKSQTDTEVILHLIDQGILKGLSPSEAVSATLERLEGAFALGIIFVQAPDLIIAARRGSPLAVGYGEGEMYMGSDATALSLFTPRIAYLEDGDWVKLTPQGAEFFDLHNKKVSRAIKTTTLSSAPVGKDGFRHYMLKEIYEQPTVIGETMNVFCNFATGDIVLPPMPFDLRNIDAITLVACGTSYYAGMVARSWFENLTHVPAHVDIASEYRYQRITAKKGSLAIFISQSGETADTLAALRAAKAAGLHCIAILNAPESTMAHEAHAVIPTYAGPEISVASTKGFTTQLTTLACIVIALGVARGVIKPETRARLMHELAEVPSRIVEVLHHEERIAKVAHMLSTARDILCMGRGSSHALALELALKLKELSYIHAEGYPAGEFKHGPLALIDEHMPVVVIAPSDPVLFAKTASNTQEVVARGGKIILISDAKGCTALGEAATAIIEMPSVGTFAAPILYALPMQLLAYHVADLRGTDIDQPRNLAKSVTVE
jgi:glucosamine--fructose-6-phosphate aminotransferase (isomerizing)